MADLEALLANCKLVDKFESDDELYEQEEEIYITLDMGELDASLLPNIDEIRVLGLGSATPFIQMGGSIFKGQNEVLLGTEILFQESDTTQAGTKLVKPFATTDQRIRFKEVQLHPKPKDTLDSMDISDADNNQSRLQRTTMGAFNREEEEEEFSFGRTKSSSLFTQGPSRKKRRWPKRPDGYVTPEEEIGYTMPSVVQGSSRLLQEDVMLERVDLQTMTDIQGLDEDGEDNDEEDDDDEDEEEGEDVDAIGSSDSELDE